jgi:hypothetical protein
MEQDYFFAAFFIAAILLVLSGFLAVPSILRWNRRRIEREHHRRKRTGVRSQSRGSV